MSLQNKTGYMILVKEFKGNKLSPLVYESGVLGINKYDTKATMFFSRARAKKAIVDTADYFGFSKTNLSVKYRIVPVKW